MMDLALDAQQRTFISVAEVWVPSGDKLVLESGNYGGLGAFAAAPGKENFALGGGVEPP